MRHLLTHTAGFESDVLGTSWTDPAEAEPLSRVAQDGLPERVRPPGTVLAYDNYAYDLAGYLVELASHQPYADYVREHILDPLGMTATSFAAPLPAGIAATMAKDYGGGTAYAHYYGHPASGTGPVTTAADMGRFMTALLSDDPRLGRGVAALMKSRAYAQDPRLPGIGYGLEVTVRNGHRLLFKGGDVNGCHELLALLPDQDTGIYLVFNGEDGLPESAYAVLDAIVDRLFPGSPEQHPLLAKRHNRHPSPSPSRAREDVMRVLKITAAIVGTTLLVVSPGGHPACSDARHRCRGDWLWRDGSVCPWRARWRTHRRKADTELAQLNCFDQIDRFRMRPPGLAVHGGLARLSRPPAARQSGEVHHSDAMESPAERSASRFASSAWPHTTTTWAAPCRRASSVTARSRSTPIVAQSWSSTTA